MYHDITHGTVITAAESEWYFRITTGTPYLTLMGELWGVYCEDFGENWPHCNATALYKLFKSWSWKYHGCWFPDSVLTHWSYVCLALTHPDSTTTLFVTISSVTEKWATCLKLSFIQWCCYGTHYNDIIMGTIASQIMSLTIVYSTFYSDTDQRKHQNSVSLAFVWGIHRWPVNSLQKGPVTRKMFPFDDVIMLLASIPGDTRLLVICLDTSVSQQARQQASGRHILTITLQDWVSVILHNSEICNAISPGSIITWPSFTSQDIAF